MTTDPVLLQEAYHFREFMRSPAHVALQKHINLAMTDTLDRLMDQGTDTQSLLHYRGIYEGLKRALTLPERVMRQAGVS